MSNLNGVVNVFGSAGNSTNPSQLSLSYLDQRYLDVAGGDKMLVNLDAGSNKIINLANPTLSTDAANKYYVDTSIFNINTIKKQIIGLFPPISSISPDNGWSVIASSTFSSSYTPNNVTLPNGGEWAT